MNVMNGKANSNDKLKIISAIISLGVIVSLVFGIYSLADRVQHKEKNLVNMNESENDVALRTGDVPEIEKPNIVNNSSISAELIDRMSDDGDGMDDLVVQETKPENPVQEPESTEEVPHVPSEAEVIANAIGKYTFAKGDPLFWPVRGDIALDFNMESTVFYKSLGVYKTSPGIIIESPKDTGVAAAASGVVIDVYDSEETKGTIKVAAGSGYEYTIGMLENVNLKIGDTVEKGQLVGNVSEPTAYYKEEGPGVYFVLTYDGKPVNPLDYLDE